MNIGGSGSNYSSLVLCMAVWVLHHHLPLHWLVCITCQLNSPTPQEKRGGGGGEGNLPTTHASTLCVFGHGTKLRIMQWLNNTIVFSFFVSLHRLFFELYIDKNKEGYIRKLSISLLLLKVPQKPINIRGYFFDSCIL